MVRKFQLISGKDTSGSSGFSDKDGNLFVVGSATDADGKQHWIVTRSKDKGDTWETVDDLVSAGGQAGAVSGMIDGKGQIYVIGNLGESATKGDWMLRRSTNAGKNWSEMDKFRRGSDAVSFGLGQSMIEYIDAEGKKKYYTCGTAFEKDKDMGWLVRTSTKGDAATFDTTDDDYRLADKKRSACMKVVLGKEHILTFGYAMTLKDTASAIVRQKTLAGTEWKTKDEFVVAAEKSAVIASAAAFEDKIYWVGYAMKSDDTIEWVVRQSLDDGTTWKTIDEFQLSSKKNAYARSVMVTADGTILVAGEATTSGDKGKWIVRKSSDSGKTWETFDEYTLDSSKSSGASGLFADDFGNVFVVGYGTDSGDKSNLIVRKLGCQTGGETTTQ